MRSLFLTATVLLLLVPVCFGETVDGYLVPSKCQSKDPKSHTKACALACSSTGFGVVAASGEYISFTPAGNTKASALLQAAAKAADLRVSVQGTRKGALLDVKSITWK